MFINTNSAILNHLKCKFRLVMLLLKLKLKICEGDRVSLLCDLLYDSENKRDTVLGPELVVLKIESVAKILFMSVNFNNPIDLSDSLKAIYVSENRIPYGRRT